MERSASYFRSIKDKGCSAMPGVNCAAAAAALRKVPSLGNDPEMIPGRTVVEAACRIP